MKEKKSNRNPSIIRHIRDIILLPVTVTVIVPIFIYNPGQTVISGNLLTNLFGILFFIFGITLFIYTVFLFHIIGKGTLAPWSPTQRMVIEGPYRYCRNPMITGVFFILIGETLYLQSTNILIWAGAFFLINTFYFILKEEPDLQKRFGDEYKRYKKNVPRWIPRIKPYTWNE